MFREGRGHLTVIFNSPIDVKELVKAGIINPATNEINWNKLSQRNDVKVNIKGNTTYEIDPNKAPGKIFTFETSEGYIF